MPVNTRQVAQDSLDRDLQLGVTLESDVGLPWETYSNPKMETDRVDSARPRIQIMYYLYKQPNSTSY